MIQAFLEHSDILIRLHKLDCDRLELLPHRITELKMKEYFLLGINGMEINNTIYNLYNYKHTLLYK